MKCAQCGYFNLPGAAICGRCKSGLDPGAPAPVAPSRTIVRDCYPPRARERTLADSVRLRVRAPEALAGRIPTLSRVRFTPRLAAPSLTSSQEDLLLICCAPLPGCAQWIQKRRRVAAAFFGAFVACCAGFVAAIHSDVSTLFVWLIAALSAASIWDASRRAAQSGSPGSGDFERLRALMLAFQSVCMLGFSIASLCLGLAQSYPIYSMRTDDAAPTFHSDDGVLVRSWSDPAHAAHRGDIVMIVLGDNYPITERLIGLAGDTVAYESGELRVNGKVLRPDQAPIAFRPSAQAFQLIVPKGQFLVWSAIAGLYGQEEGGPAPTGQPYLLASPDQIRGKVIAVYAPAAHRRWIR